MANYIRKQPFLKRNVPMYWLLIFSFLPLIGFIALATRKTTTVAAEATPCDVYSSISNERIQTYEFARPLLYYDVNTEDARLAPLKSKINDFIEQKKHENILTVASVYLKKEGGWMTINPDEEYYPASLQKVPVMITYLKDIEKNPALLDKKLYFDKHFGELPTQNIKAFVLPEHQYYTVRDLIHYMIAYSDNDALNVLFQNMNMTTMRTLYEDLKLRVPDMTKVDYTISVANYIKFFRILINASYLSNDLSEMGLKFLSESTYKEGICRNLPKEVKVVHKFGERIMGDIRELHEFAIVYRGRKAYTIGIMTRGHDLKQLSDVLSGISDIVYKDSSPATVSDKQKSPSLVYTK
jgi:hypothetical protein